MPSAVHKYSQNWIHQISERQEKEFNPRDATGTMRRRPELRYSNPAFVIDESQELANAGQTVMLLTACSYQVNNLVRELRARGEIFHNPYRRKRGDWNPFQQARRGSISTRERLIAFARPSRELHGDNARGWTYGELRTWLPLVKKTGVLRRGMGVVFERGSEDEMVEMDTMQSVFEDGALMPIMRSNLEWLRQNAATDKAKSLDYPLTVVKRKGWNKLFEQPKIVVGTIHSVKGGEADTVFLFPDLSPAGTVEYFDAQTRDNVIRQFYVGMTRAKENLILAGQSSPNAVQWT
jgi:hypothetical protein